MHEPVLDMFKHLRTSSEYSIDVSEIKEAPGYTKNTKWKPDSISKSLEGNHQQIVKDEKSGTKIELYRLCDF